MSSDTGYRPEIESLRAIAVLAVVFFHAGFDFVPGGFLGVDIFFVISGYLITKNILSDIRNKSFTFLQFYSRRFLRLYPAAAATVLITLAISFVLSPPDEVLNLSKSAISSLAAVSNIYFWSEVGYFDADAHLKPLLHTWSLGVEEQFYLIWPAVLLALVRFFNKKTIQWIVLVFGFTSFYGTYGFIKSDPSAVFYLMPFRICEFAIGIMLAFPSFSDKSNIPISRVLAGTGLIGIFCALVFLNSSVPMPSVFSLVPCLATAAIIYAGNSKVKFAPLSNTIVMYVGRISYSLYLVHWPVVSFISKTGVVGITGKLLVVVVSFVAALFLYYGIEKPLRSTKKSDGLTINIRRKVIGCICLICLASSLAILAYVSEGLRFRLPQDLLAIPTANDMWRERNPTVRVDQCFLQETQTFADFDQNKCLDIKHGKKNILILGDSFAADLYSSLRQAYPNINFLQATSGNCLPVMGNTKSGNCTDLMHFIFGSFVPRHSIDAIVLSGNWEFEYDSIEKTITFLKSNGLSVILAGPPVRFSKNVPTLIFESNSSDVKEIERFVNSKRHGADKTNRYLIEKFSNTVSFIDLHKVMCMNECDLFTADGELIYIDFGHLTKAGAIYQAKNILRSYPKLF